ncbi:NAD(P)H-binding protein [Colwelliaceae bacterium 6471]
MITKKVGIVGCGWLGLSLAKSLLSKQYDVVATKQSDEHLTSLAEIGISAVQLSLPNSHDALMENPVFKQPIIVICIPPKFKQGKRDYAKHIDAIVQTAEKSAAQRIILVSTTGIYNGLTGKVDENSSLNMAADKVADLNAAEQSVLSFSREKSILRLSGLVGPKRHPGRFFKAGRALSNPNAKLNLIHQCDAVGLLESLIQANAPMGVYNGVSQTLGTKASFYQLAAQALGQTPPSFSVDADEMENREVNGDKARQALGYQFIYDDLNVWLRE